MSRMPWIGEEREPWQNFTCGFAKAPEDLHCDRDVKFHGMKMSGDDIDCSMSACEEHVHIIRILCEYVHEHVHPCGIDGSMFRFPDNYCYIEWNAEAELPALEKLLQDSVSSWTI